MALKSLPLLQLDPNLVVIADRRIETFMASQPTPP